MALRLSGEGQVDDGAGRKSVWLEVEEYDCGCRVRFRKVDYGEAEEELPRKPVLVQDNVPCSKHKDVQDVPPPDARLVMVRHEHESYLNE